MLITQLIHFALQFMEQQRFERIPTGTSGWSYLSTKAVISDLHHHDNHKLLFSEILIYIFSPTNLNWSVYYVLNLKLVYGYEITTNVAFIWTAICLTMKFKIKFQLPWGIWVVSTTCECECVCVFTYRHFNIFTQI